MNSKNTCYSVFFYYFQALPFKIQIFEFLNLLLTVRQGWRGIKCCPYHYPSIECNIICIHNPFELENTYSTYVQRYQCRS